MLTIKLATMHGDDDLAIIACMDDAMCVVGRIMCVTYPAYMQPCPNVYFPSVLGVDYMDASAQFSTVDGAFAYVRAFKVDIIRERMQAMAHDGLPDYSGFRITG